MSMTPKERVIAQIEHHETDYLPYVLDFEREFDIEARVDAYYGSDQWRGNLENHIVRIRAVSDNFWSRKPDLPEFWTDLFGTTWRTHPRPRHPIKPALQEPTLENYSFPTIEACFDPGWEEAVYWLSRARHPLKTACAALLEAKEAHPWSALMAQAGGFNCVALVCPKALRH